MNRNEREGDSILLKINRVSQRLTQASNLKGNHNVSLRSECISSSD